MFDKDSPGKESKIKGNFWQETLTALMSALLSGLPFMMEILGMFLNNPHSRSRKVMFPTMMMWRRSAYGMFEALMINNDNGCGHN